MKESAVGSFLKFSIGFMLFISLSFGVTIAVNTYTQNQTAAAQSAAAIEAMLTSE